MKRTLIITTALISLAGCAMPYGYNGYVTQQDAQACRAGDPVACINYQRRDIPAPVVYTSSSADYCIGAHCR